jgi:D-aminopeptidase
VAGDTATCDEVRELLGDGVVTAPVKVGLSRFSARSVAPSKARQLIEEGVRDALIKREWPDAYKPEPPVVFRVELASIDQASAFAGRTGVEIAGPRTVVSTGETFWKAWNQFWHR